MNKQEVIDKQALIDELMKIPGVGSNGDALKTIKRFPSYEPQKVKVPPYVAAWIEQAKKECRTFFEVLSDIEGACFYHKGDEPTYKWVFDNDNGVKHQEIFARAWLDGYEVEEEPKWVVKVGNLYFCGWEDTTAQFVMNTVLGEDESIIKYKNEGTASSVAKNLGGTVEKV